jgi:glucose 1-dehydrogenase
MTIGSAATVRLEDWNLVLAANLTGYLLCAQAFGKAMIERGRGAIVHTAATLKLSGKHDRQTINHAFPPANGHAALERSR